MLRTALSLLLLSFSCLLQAQSLQPFNARYTADWKQLPVTGSAERNLKQASDGSWELEFKASMLVAGINESSRFIVADGQIKPQRYKYSRSGLGKAKKTRQEFDWQAMQVRGSDKGGDYQQPLQTGVQDKTSYQLALQADVANGKSPLSYRVQDGDELDIYDFRLLGEEVIETPLGKLNTLKVERVRDPGQNARKTTLWFAKDWDYLLVQLNQIERDGKEYTIMLEQGQVGSKQVKGL